ncbi:hypothetical protein GCM10009601_41810 [Streptomyces thermospinosisporus]|uniref:Sensor histidine kinase n=2 Tax=Streptomyces thermospinosisporus TaxID=161482 RepID=A0ABN1Z272_9ACTN
MRPGGRRLRPLPEVRREVELLYARIMVDHSRTHRRRGLTALLVLPLGMLIPLYRTGFAPAALVVCAGVWALFAGLWALGSVLARRRHRRYSGLLRAAGITWPPG